MKKFLILTTIILVALLAAFVVFANRALNKYQGYEFVPIMSKAPSGEIAGEVIDEKADKDYAYRLCYPKLKNQNADIVINSFAAHNHEQYFATYQDYKKQSKSLSNLYKDKYVPVFDGDYQISYGKDGYYSITFCIKERDVKSEKTTLRYEFFTFSPNGDQVSLSDLFIEGFEIKDTKFYVTQQAIVTLEEDSVKQYDYESYLEITIFYHPPVPEVKKPRIALTFDDGPNPITTPILLEGLKERGVKATFFMLGLNVEKHKKLVKSVYDEGHLVASHSYWHKSYLKYTKSQLDADIKKVNDLLQSITGEEIVYVRPPYGSYTNALLKNYDFCVINWSIDTLDWKDKDADKAVAKVLETVKDGSIILFHDIYPTSVEAALKVIDLLKDEYDFVRVDELLTKDNEQPTGGKVYRHG